MSRVSENYTGDFDAKTMLKEAAANKTKMKYKDRMTVERTTDTMYFKAGQVHSPSKVKALALIKQGLAVKVKSEDQFQDWESLVRNCGAFLFLFAFVVNSGNLVE